jgi:hypothetical protein
VCADVKPAHVAPLHAGLNVAVDLEHELPFAGTGPLFVTGFIHLRVALSGRGNQAGGPGAFRNDDRQRSFGGDGSRLPRSGKAWLDHTAVDPDWSDRSEAVAYLVEDARLVAGTAFEFDEARTRT